MNKKLIDWWIGGASYAAEYQAVLDRATTLGYTQPSAAQKTKQDTLVRALKTAGIWSQLDLFYVFATDGDRNFAELNWVAPSTYKISEPVAPTFTSNIGFSGNGTTQYLDTGFTPPGTYLTQNGAGVGCHVNTVGTVGAYYGTSTASTRFIIFAPNGNYSVNTTTLTDFGTPSAGRFYHSMRTASNAQALYENGVSVNTVASTSATPAPVPIFILANNNGGTPNNYCNGAVSMFFVGASLTGKESAFYTAWNTYFSSL